MMIHPGTIVRGVIWASVVALSPLISGCVEPSPTSPEGDAAEAPVIISLTANPPSVRVGQYAVLTCEAYDPQGARLDYRWKALVGYVVANRNIAQYSGASCCVGTNTVTVIVTNTLGSSTSGSVQVRVRP